MHDRRPRRLFRPAAQLRARHAATRRAAPDVARRVLAQGHSRARYRCDVSRCKPISLSTGRRSSRARPNARGRDAFELITGTPPPRAVLCGGRNPPCSLRARSLHALPPVVPGAFLTKRCRPSFSIARARRPLCTLRDRRSHPGRHIVHGRVFRRCIARQVFFVCLHPNDLTTASCCGSLRRFIFVSPCASPTRVAGRPGEQPSFGVLGALVNRGRHFSRLRNALLPGGKVSAPQQLRSPSARLPLLGFGSIRFNSGGSASDAPNCCSLVVMPTPGGLGISTSAVCLRPRGGGSFPVRLPS